MFMLFIQYQLLSLLTHDVKLDAICKASDDEIILIYGFLRNQARPRNAFFQLDGLYVPFG